MNVNELIALLQKVGDKTRDVHFSVSRTDGCYWVGNRGVMVYDDFVYSDAGAVIPIVNLSVDLNGGNSNIAN